MTATTTLNDTPTGTLTVVFPDGAMLGCVNAVRYEVAGDGDLIIFSRRGRRFQLPPKAWVAVGTLERDAAGGAFVAIEAFT